jgi:hypothetical protein
MAAEREHGTTTTFVVRYPDGSSEFRMNGSAPEPGDVLMGRGERWLVAEIAEHPRGALTIILQRHELEA